MPITDPLVLPADVLLVPVDALDAGTRERIAADDGDVAVTRPHSRTPSRLVDRAFAELLRQFATPKTVAEAVIAYASAADADPQTVLVDAYPVLQGLVNAGFLVEEHSEGANAIALTLQIGARVAGAAVVAPLQVTDDGELYRIAYDDGRHGALKIARAGTGAAAAAQIANETALLRRLDGGAGARLIDAGEHEGRPFVVVEWVEGTDAASAAAVLRRAGLEAVRDLCVRILDAYAELHERGVVHSDVHPRNVLVGAERVTIIDFGIAHAAENGAERRYGARAGVPFFFEPEAFTSHGMRESTLAGEQYALAAMTYLLLTGEQYLDFSVERTTLLRQIALENPVPFASRNLRPQPALERVLARALAKDPASRYSSVREFAEALASAPLAVRGDDAPADGARPAVADDGFVDRFLQRLRPGSELFASGFREPPTASVTYGAAGTAFALWRIACVRDDAELLALADAWCDRAARDVDDERGFCNDELDLTRALIGTVSPYHTASGVHAVAALIALGAGNILAAQQSIEAYLRAVAGARGAGEIVLGRGGVLLVTALLVEAIPDSDYVRADALVRAGDVLYDELFAAMNALPAIAEPSTVEFTGIAHGWAGMLYALLCWLRVRRRGTAPELAERLAQLAAYARPAGKGVRFPWHAAEKPGGPFFMPGWCNGSAGFVFLWNLAHAMFHEPRFAELAERAAANAADALHEQDSLCCGLAGQSYALLNMYNHSGERGWLARAEKLAAAARHAAARQPHPLMSRSESLYKGDLGVAVLLAELRDPEFARMPFFELDSAHHR
jgi:eukaryotic-like serine/threonine-protein kinase